MAGLLPGFQENGYSRHRTGEFGTLSGEAGIDEAGASPAEARADSRPRAESLAASAPWIGLGLRGKPTATNGDGLASNERRRRAQSFKIAEITDCDFMRSLAEKRYLELQADVSNPWKSASLRAMSMTRFYNLKG